MDPYVGRTIGRKYRIDRRLAASSSGIVFAAMQMHQDMELGSVVIKMLPRKAIKDQKIVKRFVDEARAARTLTNPHVVRVFDLDHDTGHVPYLVQEYVEGDPLNEIVVQEGKLRPVRALAIALQIAEGMEEAHQKQILHRNLQPTNVIIRARLHEDFVKVIGFGMYETLDRTGGHRTAGAERYLAPEQIDGRGEDERTDIHALGVILHEMLTGEAPVAGGPGMAELLPEADANLIDIVEMMLERDPGNRPGNMRKVVSLLEQTAQEHGLNLDITGRFTLPPEVEAEVKQPRVVPPELPGEPGRGKARGGGGRFHPAVVALAVLAGLILLAALLLGAYRLGAFLYAHQQEPVEQVVPGPADQEAVEQPPPVEKTVPEHEARIEPAEEEPPAGETGPAVKKKPRPGKKKPRPGKKKQDTPWTKL
jgi:serine/threonine protein kinase